MAIGIFICSVAAGLAHLALAHAYGFAKLGHFESPAHFYSLQAPLAKGSGAVGELIDFNVLKGRTVLITNVASECGYTANNYEQLAELQSSFGNDLAVVLIPSNDFGEQEPAPEEEIVSFVRAHGGQSYFITAKSKVNGPNQHPLLALLKKVTGTERKDITWNFETKFLVAPDGVTVTRYSDAFEPIKLMESIRHLVQSGKRAEEL